MCAWLPRSTWRVQEREGVDESVIRKDKYSLIMDKFAGGVYAENVIKKRLYPIVGYFFKLNVSYKIRR